mmetsp:Transcript_103301/g.274760  ORF Transcript_103301/g.274760 Transcript_103301/m.274760 type:complete len:234 (+) Transcript_103301:1006-1707(+)
MPFGTVEPGMLPGMPFVMPSGGASAPFVGNFRSAFGRRLAQVARARTSAARSLAWRAKTKASRADLRPVSLSSFSRYAPAREFSAWAWPTLSSSSLKSATASLPAFSDASPSFCMTCASARVWRANACPFLLPASLKSDAASVAFSTAAFPSFLARDARDICLQAFPFTSLSELVEYALKAASSASSARPSRRKASDSASCAPASMVLSPSFFAAVAASLLARMAESDLPLAT